MTERTLGMKDIETERKEFARFRRAIDDLYEDTKLLYYSKMRAGDNQYFVMGTDKVGMKKIEVTKEVYDTLPDKWRNY